MTCNSFQISNVIVTSDFNTTKNVCNKCDCRSRFCNDQTPKLEIANLNSSIPNFRLFTAVIIHSTHNHHFQYHFTIYRTVFTCSLAIETAVDR